MGELLEDEFFRLAIEAAPTGMLMVDADDRIVLVNTQAERIFGYSRAELLGQSVDVLVPERYRGLHPGHRAGFRHAPVPRPMGAGRELFALRKDRAEVPVEIGLTPLLTGSGTYVITAVADITERKRAEAEQRRLMEGLERMVAERDVLLREVHHRVKNNLQLICSLLGMQARRIYDTRGAAALLACRNRVESIAMIHERLYQSENHASVAFRTYAQDLAQLARSIHPSEGVTVELDVDDVQLPVDRAIPCALILNELITNALKHAFPDGHGTLRVELRAMGDELVLRVSDDGAGLPEHPAGTSLGFVLIHTLADQLGGQLEIRSEHGTTVALTVKRHA